MPISRARRVRSRCSHFSTSAAWGRSLSYAPSADAVRLTAQPCKLVGLLGTTCLRKSHRGWRGGVALEPAEFLKEPFGVDEQGAGGRPFGTVTHPVRQLLVLLAALRHMVVQGLALRYFATKDDLVLAFLQCREQHWTLGFVEAEAKGRDGTPEGQLLAIFDAFDEWFHGADFDTCTFITVLLEMRARHPLGRASIQHLANIRAVVQEMAKGAGLRDARAFARSWHILMNGSIIAAAEGDLDAARRAQEMGRGLISRHG